MSDSIIATFMADFSEITLSYWINQIPTKLKFEDMNMQLKNCDKYGYMFS